MYNYSCLQYYKKNRLYFNYAYLIVALLIITDQIIIYFGIGDANRLKKNFKLEEIEIYEVPELKSNKKNLAKLCSLKRADKKDIPTMSDEEIRTIVNDFYDKITPIIQQVENKLLEKKKELEEMRNISV